MNLADVMVEAATVLKQITGLNVQAYPAESISPPAGYMSYPQRVVFDASYGRGIDRIEGLPLTVLAGAVTKATARDVAGRWAEGSGPDSVKARMEAHRWLSCSDFQVTGCTFDIETVGSVPYLAVVFTADVMGSGRS